VADAGETAPTRFLADWVRLPRADDARYLDVLVEQCPRLGVQVIVPTIDTELDVLARGRAALLSVGVQVAMSSLETIEICGDKLMTHEHLRRHGIPTPETRSFAGVVTGDGAIEFPVMVKPARGSMSRGVSIAQDGPSLMALAPDEPMVVQELLTGPELTVSTFVGWDGRSRVEVPRQRLEVRGGEVSKGITVRDGGIESLARRAVESLPGAFGPLNVQVMVDPVRGPSVIEINARFGGGDPLAWTAGADIPGMLLDELSRRDTPDRCEDWVDGLLMSRFDRAVFHWPSGRTDVG
jgi:carbamoyl-phosphate synthase large subunit